MNKLKKISLILSIITLLGIIFSLKTYATLGGGVSLTTPESSVMCGEEVYIYIRITNLKTDKGIVATRRTSFI